MPARALSGPLVAALRDAKIVGLRAGREDHRFIGVWVVVVGNRAFVRPWNDKASGWRRAFLDDPVGMLQVGDRQVRIRVRAARGGRLWDRIDQAYAEKYPTPGSRAYVRGFRTPRRRATTLELLPR
jgi:hypothetical protein